MKSPFVRMIKYFFKIAGITLVSFLCLGIMIGLFYGNEVKNMMLAQINKNLNTEISTKEFTFSVLRHFPNASFDMKQILAKEVTESNMPDTLLYAEHLSLLFNITSVFNKNIAIKKIVVSEGKVKIRVDKTGKDNYHFWKSSNDTVSSSVIDLKKIVLNNIQIHYLNLREKQDYLLQAKEGSFSGKFSGDVIALTTNADLFIHHFIVHGTDYAPGKKASLRSDIGINNKTGEYVFTKSRIQLADLVFDVNGKVTSLKNTTRLDLAIAAQEASMESFLRMVPAEYENDFRKYKSKGKIQLTCSLKGDADAKNDPDIVVHFSVKNGKMSPEKSDITIEKIVASGSLYKSAQSKKYVLKIPTLSAMLGGRNIHGNLMLEDFDNPFLTLNATANLDLNRVRHFMKLDTLESLSGDLGLNISFAGKIKDLPRYRASILYKVQASGDITLKDVSFKIKRNPLKFKNINGNFSLHNNNVNVASLAGNISSSDFQLKGVFRNFITFLLIPGQDADVDARFTADEIDLDELLTNKNGSAGSDTSYRLKFNPRLVCKLDVEVGKLHFRKFAASQVKGKIVLEDQVIRGNGLSFNSMKGMVHMDAVINAARKDSVIMSCEAKCLALDINQLFFQLENFDQNTMTDKNVKGKINADIRFKSSWTTDLQINPASAVSTCEITIENGELHNFKPLLALSKYLKLADLKHIRFATLKNQIRISNRKIYIPNMEINSSASNLHISGIHDFDNIVDYQLQMLLSDVLGKKMKNQNTEFGQVEDDGLGRTKLFLTMRGPVDDPKIGYDKKAVADKIKSNIKTGKQNMKSLLTQEFSRTKEAPSTPSKKKEEMQIDW